MTLLSRYKLNSMKPNQCHEVLKFSEAPDGSQRVVTRRDLRMLGVRFNV